MGIILYCHVFTYIISVWPQIGLNYLSAFKDSRVKDYHYNNVVK